MSGEQTSDSQARSGGTQRFLNEQGRRVALEEHGELIHEMEQSIGDNLVSGSADNPRLKRVIEALDNDEAKARMTDAILAMASNPAFVAMPLQQALIEHSCVLRGHLGTEVAQLQIHIIGVYRHIRELMYHQQSLVPDLFDLRTLPTNRLERLLNPLPLSFGSPSSADALVVTETQREKILELAWQFLDPEDADDDWEDGSRDLLFSREDEAGILLLPLEERTDARRAFRNERIRKHVYDILVHTYLGRDELGDDELDAHFTLLHWMQQMAETPQLYPFMQGQTTRQKRFRLAHLGRKLLQLHELYQRIDRAQVQEPYASDGFADLPTSQQLQRMHQGNFPPLDIDDDFIVTALLCPFATFARWTQRMVSEERFLIPGD